MFMLPTESSPKIHLSKKDIPSNTDTKIDTKTGHRERLRQKFLHNSDSLMDYELLELLLSYAVIRRDTKNLAKEVLSVYKSLPEALSTSVHDLVKNTSMNQRSSLLLKLVHICITRSMQRTIEKTHVLSSWSSLLDYCFVSLRHEKVENIKVILLNARMEIIKDVLLSKGTINANFLFPREIIKLALDAYASGIILVHNHPSAVSEPSKADIASTKNLKQACALLDIHLHDHLIVNKEKVFSFKLQGLM